MATNPFDSKTTDLGLISKVSGDVLGSPDKVAELQGQLASIQGVLGQAPPQPNNFVQAAIKGAIAGSQGTNYQHNPFTGEDTAGVQSQGGFGQGLLAGMGAAIEGSQAAALAKYQAQQKQAQAALDQQDKVSSGVRMVLAQNPLAFEKLAATPDGQRTLGQLAFGVDIPIDPTAKASDVDDTLRRKQRISYLTQVMHSAVSPAKKAEATQALRDLVDPDGVLSVTPEDMVGGKLPSYSEVGKLYGDAGLKALSDYRLNGDTSALFTTLGALKVKDASKVPPSVRVKLDLAQKIARIKNDYRDANGKDLSDIDAIKQLPDEDRIIAENQFRNIAGNDDGFSMSRISMELGKAYDDQPFDTRNNNPEQAYIDARNLAVHRIMAASSLKKQVDKAQSAKSTPPAAPNANVNAWQAAVVARAKKDGTNIATANSALVNEYIQGKKENQIPAVARKKAGM